MSVKVRNDKDKVLTLYDYYQREIKDLINFGRNRSSPIATKITSILVNSKNHGWDIHQDIKAVRESLYEKWEGERTDEVLSSWYSDLKAIHDEDTESCVNKVIDFYIKKFSLSEEEKTFYKEFQRNQYLNWEG